MSNQELHTPNSKLHTQRSSTLHTQRSSKLHTQRSSTQRSARFAYVPIPDGFARLSRRGKFTWVALCAFMNWKTRRCFPSLQALSEFITLDSRQVRLGISELEDAGLITQQKLQDGKTIFAFNPDIFCKDQDNFCKGDGNFCSSYNIRNNKINNNMNNRGNNRENAPRNQNGAAPDKPMTAEDISRLPLFQKGGFFDQ